MGSNGGGCGAVSAACGVQLPACGRRRGTPACLGSQPSHRLQASHIRHAPAPAPAAPQELLEFSLVHQAQWAADGDLFGEGECDEGEGGMALGAPAPSDLAAGAAEGGGAAAPAAVPAST